MTDQVRMEQPRESLEQQVERFVRETTWMFQHKAQTIDRDTATLYRDKLLAFARAEQARTVERCAAIADNYAECVTGPNVPVTLVGNTAKAIAAALRRQGV